jgi:cyclopropane-fatty-acyl-phospholipid synthase
LPRSSDAAARTLAALRMLFRGRSAVDFSVALWDGTRIAASRTERFTLIVRAPFALRAAFAPPLDLSPARAYIEDWIDIAGDAEAAVDTLERAVQSLSHAQAVILAARVWRLPKPPRLTRDSDEAHLHGKQHSRRRDVAAIAFHYDQPVTFYQTFLDPNLVYSCAYFEHDDFTLQQAQEAKIDYVLRKLRLTPGERLLDIGCGWGALVMRAAERFGAQALGITLSRSQYDVAQRSIAERGLAERAGVELRDYRDLRDMRFDKIVSIGMVEHVGRSRLRAYFESAFRALVPGGLFLNHGIADQSPGRRGLELSGFIGHYIFPDGELEPIGDMLSFAERSGFEVRDVENLREHYHRTLRAWVANIERNAKAAVEASGERAFRAWRIYMAGSAQGFHSGRMGIFQSLLAKPATDGSVPLPPTRRDLYATA